MSRISFILILIIAIASLPLINNWLSNRSQMLSDDYICEKLDNYLNRNFDKIVKTLKEESIKSSYAAQDNVTKVKFHNTRIKYLTLLSLTPEMKIVVL